MLMKNVSKVRYYKHPNTPIGAKGGKVLTLECGHTVYMKYSRKTPRRCNCKVCWNIKYNGYIY